MIRSDGESEPRLKLLTLAGATLLVYVGFALFFVAHPNADERRLMQTTATPMVAALAVLYWLGYRCFARAHHDRVAVVIGLGSALVFAAVCILIPPFHSDDLYGYVNRGWLQYHYGLNPYAKTLRELPGWQADPMFTRFWISNPCPYGFLFGRLTRAAAMLGKGDLGRTLTVFKLISLCAWGGTAALLYCTARKLGLRRPEIALYLYLWNPLILLHEIANGHNDVVMTVFMMLGVYLIAAEWWIAAMPALAAASLIKYPAGIVVPFALILAIRKRGIGVAVMGTFAAILTVLIVGAPYLADLRDFKLYAMAANLGESVNSLQATILGLVDDLNGAAPAFALPRDMASLVSSALIWTVTIVVAAILLLGFCRLPEPSTQCFIAAALGTAILVICVGSSKFYPWYIAMFFPLALVLEEDDWLRTLGIALSATELLYFTLLPRAPGITYLVATAMPIIFAIAYQRTLHHRAAAQPPRSFSWYEWLMTAAVIRTLSRENPGKTR